MGVSKNRSTPKSSILIGLSIMNHPFWGTTIFGNTIMKFIIHPFKSAPCLEQDDSQAPQVSWELARSKAAPAKNWQKAAPWACFEVIPNDMFGIRYYTWQLGKVFTYWYPKIGIGYTSWWLQPIWKILVKLDHFLKIGVKIKNDWNHHLVIS